MRRRRTPVFLPGECQGGEAWLAAVYGVAQSRTRLKRRMTGCCVGHSPRLRTLPELRDFPGLRFPNDFVPPAPRGPLPAAPLAAPERQPSWDPSPVSSSVPAPSPPSIAADSHSKLSEDEEPPARPPPPPPADVSPQAEPSWTSVVPAPAAPPSTPAAPKRRGSSGSVGECRALRLAPPLAPLPLLCAAPQAWTLPFSPSGGGFVCRSLGEGAPAGGSRGEQGGAAEEARAYSLLSVWVSGSTCAPTAPRLFCLLSIPPGRGS